MYKDNGYKIAIFGVSFKKSVGESFSVGNCESERWYLLLANAILMYCESLEQVMYRNIQAIIKYPC